MKTIHPSPFLRFALWLDASISGATAVLQLTAAGWLAQVLQLPRPLLIETGVFFVAYTLLLVVLARSARIWMPLIVVIVFGNLGWAIACLGLLASGVAAPSSLGTAYVVVQAFAVAVFAGLQALGWKRSVIVSSDVMLGTR